MSDYGDDFDASDDDWAYLDAEDVYDEIDDLIEHTCPSPAVECNRTEPNEYDTYDYFNVDLEYLSDSYFDNSVEFGARKKRRSTTIVPDNQRQKHRGEEPSCQKPVLWRSQIIYHELPIVQSLPTFKPFALLQDWRERFHNVRPITLNAPCCTPSEASTDAFNVNNLQSFAKLLVGDSLEALMAELVARGLDREAIHVVLGDLMSGQDPVLDTGHDEENESHAMLEDDGLQSDYEEDVQLPRDASTSRDTVEAGSQRLTRRQVQKMKTANETKKVTTSRRDVDVSRPKHKQDNPLDEKGKTSKRKARSDPENHEASESTEAIRKRSRRS